MCMRTSLAFSRPRTNWKGNEALPKHDFLYGRGISASKQKHQTRLELAWKLRTSQNHIFQLKQNMPETNSLLTELETEENMHSDSAGPKG